MSKYLQDKSYYKTNSGKIPVKWTAPEVSQFMDLRIENISSNLFIVCRPFTFRNIPLRAMYGAME